MISAVGEIREVYKSEISSEYELRWFLAHARRFMEQAQAECMEAEILIGTIFYTPHNLNEFQETYREILQKGASYFNKGQKVFCRIIFRTP